MTYVRTSSTPAPPSTRPPVKTLRERGADSFHAALAGLLFAGLEEALAAGDHAKAVDLVNRGFAEGTPQLGCDLLCRAMAVVGASRTWTVQIAPQTQVRRLPPTRPGGFETGRAG